MNAPETLLADSIRRMLQRHDGGNGAADTVGALGPAYVAGGYTHALIAGAGDDPRDALRDGVAILRESAYHGVALPLAESLLANWLAAHAGWPAEDTLCTVAIQPRGPALDLTPDDGAPIAASIARVPWARAVPVIYALGQRGTACHVVRVVRSAPIVAEGSNLAGEPADTVRVDAIAASDVRIGAQSIGALDVLALAALLRSAQMVGAIERSLDLALEHARTRVQFGRAIGRFQAVQQMLAQHAGHVAAAAAALDLAVDYWGSEHATLNCAIAKARIGEAAGVASECAHQIIAAMGFAMEHPLQRVTRRLWSWRDDYGNEAFWNALIGSRFIAATADGVWPLLVDHPARAPRTASR